MTQIDLRLGDCLEILPMLADSSVDAVITDPPYNVGFAKWDKITDYESWARIVMNEWQRVSKRQAFIPGMPNVGVWSSIKYPKWIICWYKPAAMKRSPFGFCNWEAVLFYGKSVVTHGFTDVIKAPIVHQDFDHPTIKPLELMKGIVERVSSPADTILDPFMGSGTTGVACVQTGRNFIGIEIEPKYFEIAEKRIKEAQLQIRMPI